MKILKTKLNTRYISAILAFAIFIAFLIQQRIIQDAFLEVGTIRTIGVIIELILIGSLFIFNPKFKKIIGEDRPEKRQFANQILQYSTILLVVAFTFIFIKEINDFLKQFSSQGEQGLTSLNQLTLIVISTIFAGIPLVAASISGINPIKKKELICVSKKFIDAILLFLIAVACIFLFDQLTESVNAWVYDILVWLIVPSFYGSVMLFLAGIIDLPFAFYNLDINTNDIDQIEKTEQDIYRPIEQHNIPSNISAINTNNQETSIDLIYEIVKEQHSLMSSWSDSIDNKVIGLVGIITLIIGAVTTLNKGNIIIDLQSIPLAIAILFFIISASFCFKAYQTKDYSFGLNTRILIRDYATETPQELKYWLVKFDGDNFEKNVKAINNKAKALTVAILTSAIEIISLIIWIVIS